MEKIISILQRVLLCRAPFPAYGPSLVAQMVKNLPAKQETGIREGPPEEGMATHPSVLAWEIPWTEEPGGLQSMGLQRVRNN